MPQGQGCVALLQLTHITLKALIPKLYDFEPKNLGEHIRKKRLKMGLTQKELAKQFGVVPWTILNWEKGHTEPPIKSIPAILQFLGNDPYPTPKTLSDHLLTKRREMGWTIKAAAEAVGVDPGTWGNWERGRTIHYRKHHALIAQTLKVPINSFDEAMSS